MIAAGQTAAKAAKDTTKINTFTTITASKGPQEAKTLARAGRTSQWLNVLPTATLG